MSLLPASAPAPEPIPLQILTGYLGAGKTTLLNGWLRHADLADSLVIINEFGEIGLDHLLVEGLDDGLIVMESGCLCCTLRGDLVTMLEDILRRRDNGRISPFGRVIIETTGLADPAPLLHVVLAHPYLSRRFSLAGVITVVDAVNGMATLDASEEALKQVVVADRIIVTKTDLLPADGTAEILQTRLRQLNPGVDIRLAGHGEASEPDERAPSVLHLGLYDLARRPAEVDAWLAIEAVLDPGAHSHAHDVNRHDDHIRAVTLTADQPVRQQTFDLFWTLMRSTHGPKLLRLKGLVALAEHPDEPLLVHAAQTVLHPPIRLAAWPSADRRSRLVMIVRDLDDAVVRRLWAAFLGES